MSERKDRVMCSKLGEKGKREGGLDTSSRETKIERNRTENLEEGSSGNKG